MIEALYNFVLANLPQWLPMIYSFLIATLLPIILLIARINIRIHRIRMLDEYRSVFEERTAPSLSAKRFKIRAKILHQGRIYSVNKRHSLSFEYARSKYICDLDLSNTDKEYNDIVNMNLSSISVRKFLQKIGIFRSKTDKILLISSIPYIFICTLGFYGMTFLLQERVCGIENNSHCASIFQNKNIINIATLSIIAFISSYLFCLKNFIFSIINFTLTPTTFLRSFYHIIFTISVVIILYTSISTEALLGMIYTTPDQSSLKNDNMHLWRILAFFFGLIPGSAFQVISMRFPRKFFKGTDTRYIPYAQSTPLDLIDGVDFFTRFQLEEANINEVQSLACANPIMLLIETSYGLYQIVDWIAQAQLCTIVGPERFLTFRLRNIRTIFDLERAITPKTSTEELRKIVASILLSRTEAERNLNAETKLEYFISSASGTPPSNDSETFRRYMADVLADPKKLDAFILQYATIILDDLHVYRLRQVWKRVAKALGKDAESLN